MNWLLDIALEHLTLGRAYLGLGLTVDLAELRLADKYLNRAVEGLRQAGQQDELPRGLFARAALRRFQGDVAAAAGDLREAGEIAERGQMRLFEADAQLEWTRIHLQQEDQETASRHLARARDLIEACGYGRRRREVTWLEGRLAAGKS